MTVEINDVSKTIVITQATSKELKKLIKKYKGYSFSSKIEYNWWQPSYGVYSVPCDLYSTECDSSGITNSINNCTTYTN